MENKKRYENAPPAPGSARIERYEGAPVVRQGRRTDDEVNPEDRHERRREPRPRRRRHSKLGWLLMLLGALALFYLLAKFAVIPVLVWVQTLVGGAA